MNLPVHRLYIITLGSCRSTGFGICCIAKLQYNPFDEGMDLWGKRQRILKVTITNVERREINT
jgi:hypothetical protein